MHRFCPCFVLFYFVLICFVLLGFLGWVFFSVVGFFFCDGCFFPGVKIMSLFNLSWMFFKCVHECLANNQCDVSTTVWTTNCSAGFEEVKEVFFFLPLLITWWNSNPTSLTSGAQFWKIAATLWPTDYSFISQFPELLSQHVAQL